MVQQQQLVQQQQQQLLLLLLHQQLLQQLHQQLVQQQQQQQLCAVFHSLLVAVDQVTAARTHEFLQFFVSDETLATQSHHPYRLATMPVTLQVIFPAL